MQQIAGRAPLGMESKGSGVLHAGRLWHGGTYFVDSCCFKIIVTTGIYSKMCVLSQHQLVLLG